MEFHYDDPEVEARYRPFLKNNMSLFIDVKYIGLVSSRLKKFTRTKDFEYTFRCPICLDSKKNLNKRRGYLYRQNNEMMFKCHNCGIAENIYGFLKMIDVDLFRHYAMEKLKEQGYTFNKKRTEPIVEKPLEEIPEINYLEGLETIGQLPSKHYAKEYIRQRQIPKEHWDKLYFVEDFGNYIEAILPNNEYQLKKDDPRILIPFFNKKKEIIAFQGRSLIDPVARYITIKVQKGAKKVFGEDRLDPTKRIYMVEGPFDSLFLDNCLAVAGSDLGFPEYRDNMTIVLDNEPRSPEIIAKMEKLITQNYTMCIWPTYVKQKDINDMVVTGLKIGQVKSIIENHSWKGLAAKVKLNRWKSWAACGNGKRKNESNI